MGDIPDTPEVAPCKDGAKNDSSDAAGPGFKFANNVLLSIIIATLFAVLVIVGYSHTAKVPNPMKLFLAKQDNMMASQEEILEQGRNMAEQLSITTKLTENIAANVDLINQALSQQHTSQELPRYASCQYSDHKTKLNTNACKEAVNRLVKNTLCHKDINCIGPQYVHLQQYLASPGVTEDGLREDRLIADLLLYMDRARNNVVNARFLQNFLRISKKTYDPIAEIDKMAHEGIDCDRLEELGVPAAIVLRARAIQEQRQFYNDISATIADSAAEARNNCEAE